MLSKRIIIFSNNSTFTTWDAKIAQVKTFYQGVFDLEFTLIHTEFTNVPVTEQQVVSGPTNALVEAYIVDPTWYEQHIDILTGESFDAAVFALNTTDMAPETPLFPAGVNSGSFDGVDQITLFIQPGSENWLAQQNGVDQGNAIAFILCHELSHWFYPMVKLPVDNTHEYFYSSNPSGVIPELQKAMSISSYSQKIILWAKTIQDQEGGKPTDRNMVDNNPGNIRATTYAQSLGHVTAIDYHGVTDGGKGFCIYESYQIGFDALCELLTDACMGDLIAFRPSMNIAQFTEVYAMPPNANYANAVATALGVPVETPISNLLLD